ncbi:MAG: Ku protein, partial [Acidimicrobiales bacterium]
LYSATTNHDIRFHQVHAADGGRIKYKRTCAIDGEEVEYADIVKGYEVAPGEYVVVEPDELEAVEPGRSRTIDVEELIDLADVDPIWFDRSYYLAPAEGAGAGKAYALLAAAMKGSGRAAVGRLVLRAKQHLVVIRPRGDVLVLETLYYPDEVRDPAEELPPLVPEDGAPSERELEMAGRLLDSLAVAWDPSRYHDTYRERVLELVESKAAGEHVVGARPAEQPGQVVDLRAAREASLAEARGREGDGSPKSQPELEGKDGATPGYRSWSKDDLYEEARRRDLPGRSKMTRDQLVAALEKAAEPGVRRAS